MAKNSRAKSSELGDLVTVLPEEFTAARSGSRRSLYAELVARLPEGVPVDVTATLSPTGTARTVRSAVLNAARKAEIVVRTAETHDAHVLVIRGEQLTLAEAARVVKGRAKRKSTRK